MRPRPNRRSWKSRSVSCSSQLLLFTMGGLAPPIQGHKPIVLDGRLPAMETFSLGRYFHGRVLIQRIPRGTHGADRIVDAFDIQRLPEPADMHIHGARLD